jgi:transposase-like protein
MWEQRLYELTDKKKQAIVEFREQGIGIAALAKRFGVSTTTIWRTLDESKAATTKR